MHLESAIVFGSLAIAVAVIVARSYTIPGLDMKKRMGPPNWDFSKSWASSFTVLAAALGTLVSAKSLVPEHPQFLANSASYGALTLAFGLIVVLAPFLYRGFSSPVAFVGGEPQYEGDIRSFLVCTLLTLWAALGQLVTVSLMLAETQPSSIATEVMAVLEVPFVGSAPVLIVYVFLAIKWTIDAQPKTLTDQTRPSAWNMP